jgi:hypothetical protein
MKQPQGHPPSDAADPTWRSLYYLGSIAALLYVVMILIPLVLLFVAPQPPATGGAEVLVYIADHKLVYLVELISFVGLSVPALVVFTAVAVSLKNVDKTIALLGGLMGVVSETIALALGSSPQSLSGTLIGLSSRYAGATSEAARQAISAAAEGVVAGTNAVSWAGILTALGIMVLSIGMRRGPYGRAVAWIGIATGAAGVVLEALRPQVGAFYGIYGILLPLWFVLVGIALNREARRGDA